MKNFILTSLMGLFVLVTSELMVTSPESLFNISVLDISKRDALPIDFAVSSPSDPGFLAHISDISDVEYQKAVCRGQKLFLAMTRDSTQGTRYINPLTTPWDGILEKEGLIWAWDNWLNKDFWCTFNKEGLSNALKGLSINDKSATEGGDNACYSAFNYNSAAVLFDPKDMFYLDDPEGRMLPIDKQYYLDPAGKRQRCTGAMYTFGVNARAGVLYFVARRSPLESAKTLWKFTPQTSELPDLRMSSDFAWGIWNKLRGPDKLGDIRKIMSLYITNKDTEAIMDRALAKKGVKEIKRRPGTEIDAKSEEGLAIIGSTGGRAAGYFLAQHKRQLGGDKYISKINIFRTDEEQVVRRNILFYIDDVPSPPPEMAEPKEEDNDKGTGLAESKLAQRGSTGTSLVRQHVVWTEH